MTDRIWIAYCPVCNRETAGIGPKFNGGISAEDAQSWMIGSAAVHAQHNHDDQPDMIIGYRVTPAEMRAHSEAIEREIAALRRERP